MGNQSKPRRRWFRFSLRTFFVLLTVFGLGLGWLTIQKRWKQDRGAAMNWFRPTAHFGRLGRFGQAGTDQPYWGLRVVGAPGIPTMTIQVRTTEDEQKAADLIRFFPECEVRIEREK